VLVVSVDHIDGGVVAPDELPLFLTREEAAAVPRISRTLAYELAHRYRATAGVDGLPVVRLGRRLRVPRRAVAELASPTGPYRREGSA